MPTLISSATGNFTAAGTWKVADSASLLNTNVASTVVTTTYVASQTFIPGAITIDAIGCYLLSRSASPTGTFSIELYNSTDALSVASVTVNVSDLAEGSGWYIFPVASTLLIAGKAYSIRLKTSVGTMVTAHRDATANNWCRVLRTTTTAAPGAGDNMIVAGEHTGAGTGNDFDVTMDNTTGTVFGAAATNTPFLSVSKRASLKYGTAAATNYRLRHAGWQAVYDGGVYHRGDPVTPIPATSTATQEFSVSVNVDSGIEVFSGGTYKTCGTLLGSVTKCYLAADVSGGATTLTTDVAAGWKAGDEIVIAPTGRTTTEGEKRTLSVDASGTTLTLSSGLTYAHSGSTGRQAEIINLTRNVKVFGTSTSLCGYVYIRTGAIVDIDYTEHYYLGTSSGVKRGVYIEAATADFTGNSFHDNYVTVSGAMGLYFSTAGYAATVTDNVFWKCGYIGIYAIGVSCVSATFQDNWSIGDGYPTATYGFLLQTAGENVIDNHSAGSNAGVNVTGAAAIKVGTVSGNVAHSCTNGLTFTGLADSLISNSVAWRTGGMGVTFSGCANTWLDTVISVGNASGSITVSGNYGGGVLDITGHGESGFTQPYSIYIAGLNVETVIARGIFGGASAPQAATNGDIVHTAVQTDIIFHDTQFLSPVEHYVSSWSFGNGYKSEKHDGIAGNNKWVMPEGTITRNTTIYDTGGTTSARMTPANANFKLHGPIFEAAVLSGGTVAVSVRIRKSVVGDGTAYNGNNPRLIVQANPIAGIDADTVLATASGAAGSWETVSGTTIAVSENTRLKFFIDCDGTTGWINYDNISLVSADTSTCEIWADGMVYAVGASDVAALYTDVDQAKVELGYAYKYNSPTNNRAGTRRQPATGEVKHDVVFGPGDTLTGTYRGADLWSGVSDADMRDGVLWMDDGVIKTGRVVIAAPNTILAGTPSDTDGATLGTAVQATSAAIAIDLLAALNVAMLPVNLKQINDADVIGDGTPADPWRGIF